VLQFATVASEEMHAVQAASEGRGVLQI